MDRRLPLPLLALLLATVAAALAPGAASAAITEVGKPAANPGEELPAPACPSSPCFAISRTTGYQAKVGPDRTLYQAPADGRIVAWTIRLSNPGKKQTAFFTSMLGGAPSAGIAVVRPRKGLNGTVVSAGPIQQLERYFGQTAQFPLERSIGIRKGDFIALTVPTWAPALAVGLPGDTSWRASRAKDKCSDTDAQTAQQRIGATSQYRCLYRTARLTYSATLVTTPTPNAADDDSGEDGDASASRRR